MERDDARVIFNSEVQRWFANYGDLTHRINYNELNQDSIVLDIGGFKGEWASDIFSKYLCYVLIFEPVTEYYKFIENRFKMNPKIMVHNNAFGKDNERVCITISEESSSMFISDIGHQLEEIEIRSFNEFIDTTAVDIDLVKINIEGSEYELLESLSDDNFKKLKNIQVQFHTFVDDCITRRNKIRERLSLTHDCTYCYDFVWENWKIRS